MTPDICEFKNFQDIYLLKRTFASYNKINFLVFHQIRENLLSHCICGDLSLQQQ